MPKKPASKSNPAVLPAPKPAKPANGRPRTGNKAVKMLRGKDGSMEPAASHAHLDHAYNAFLEGIPDDELQLALATAPGAGSPKSKFSQALTLLTHPAFKRESRRGTGLPGAWSVAALLKQAGVTLPELMDTYGRYRTAKAMRIAMDRSPRIISDAADDAENRKVVCPRCDGLGVMDMDAVREETQSKQSKRQKAVVRTCPECEGTGKVTQSGDSEARKLVLEVAGITNKKGPVVDARSVHYGHGVFSVESLVKGMETLDNSPDSPDSLNVNALPMIEGETEETQ